MTDDRSLGAHSVFDWGTHASSTAGRGAGNGSIDSSAGTSTMEGEFCCCVGILCGTVMVVVSDRSTRLMVICRCTHLGVSNHH
jgi:hypothetical protein